MIMSNEKRQCSNCEFYYKNSCHLNPPVYQYVYKPVDQNRGNVEREGGWPHVKPEDWCGQFEEKNN